MKATVRNVSASHVPIVSQPDATAGFIAEAAKSPIRGRRLRYPFVAALAHLSCLKIDNLALSDRGDKQAFMYH